MTSTTDQLNLGKAFIALGIIIIVASVAVVIALFFNNQRRINIITQYDRETQNFISSNLEKLDIFFNQTFDECAKVLSDKQASESAMYNSTDVICPQAEAMLAELNDESMKDSSAIAYVKFRDNQYELIEASGKYNEKKGTLGINFTHFTYREDVKKELFEYFKTGKGINRWQDFISYLPGKEVVVPVVINDQIQGYMFRGVIEK